MKRALASVCMGGSIGDKLVAAAEVGYDGIEIFEPDLTVSTMKPAAVATLAADLGLRIVCLQPLRDFEGAPTAAARAANLERARHKLHLALELGTDMVCVPSSTRADVNPDRGRMAAELAGLADLAGAMGLRIAYEALSWGTVIADSIDAWDMVQRVDHPSLGLLLDSYHFFVRDNPLEWLDDIDGDRIFLVQLADAPRFVMDTIRHSRHLRLFPGQGDYPVVEFVRRIRAGGYDDWFSHEIFNDEFRAADPTQTAVDGYRSLSWLDEQIADQRPPPTGPITMVELGGLAAWEVGAVLQQVGAAHSKLVRDDNSGAYALALGDAAVIVDPGHRSATAPATTYVSKLGTSPNAVTSPSSTPSGLVALAKRAAHYRIGTTTDRPDTELLLARVGHTEIVAIDDLDRWLADAGFRSTTEEEAVDRGGGPAIALPGGSGVGGQPAIDEVALGVASTEVAHTVLELRTMLAVEPTARAEFADPGGLATVADLISADQALRFRVQSSHGRGSRAGRFLDAVGGGVIHVAFTVEDIMATAAGLPPDLVLDIADNYYDDLAARWALAQDDIGLLRRHRVLLDRSDDGDILRIVCQPTAGISIGFVERRGHRGLPQESEAAVAAALRRRAEQDR